MSDLNAVGQKLSEGAEWRGTIHVTIQGEEHELTVRQLRDPEFEEVMDLVDRDELRDLREALPQETMEKYRELQEQEELDEDESERLAELEEELQNADVDMFDVLSTSTFEGIRKAAKYGVEPDDEDLKEAFMERAAEIEAEYGIKVQTPDDVREPLNDDIADMIEKSTNFVSFNIGIRVLTETVGEEGN